METGKLFRGPESAFRTPTNTPTPTGASAFSRLYIRDRTSWTCGLKPTDTFRSAPRSIHRVKRTCESFSPRQLRATAVIYTSSLLDARLARHAGGAQFVALPRALVEASART